MIKIFKLSLVLSVSLLAVTDVTANEIGDLDHDGIADNVDQCLNTPAMRKFNASSKYAVLFSKQELSPTPVSVSVDSRGCALDSDTDKVPDYRDYCPDNSAMQISKGVNKNGCPLQSDSDGTPDYRDNCPGTAMGVKSDRFGYPV